MTENIEKEVDNARQWLMKMRYTDDSKLYENLWSEFLGKYGKIVNHIRFLATKKAYEQKHISQFDLLVNKDPLLNYLLASRHSDQHKIVKLLEFKAGSLHYFVPGGPGVVHIERMIIRGGIVTEYVGSHPLMLRYNPGKWDVLPVVNRGKKYPVPESHLGKKLANHNPVYLGEMALKFLREY